MKAVIFLAMLLGARALHAEVRWQETELVFRPTPGATEVHGEFRFENTGRRPITIQSVEPECGCTMASLNKRDYQPGEKGVIGATFTFGQRRGEQIKHIAVQVAGEAKPTTLTLTTLIAEQVRLTPNFVYWQAGETPTPKTIAVTIVQESPLALAKVSSSNGNLSPKLETVREGREYRLVVTPVDTSVDAMAVLNIESNAVPPVVFQAYAQVKRPVK